MLWWIMSIYVYISITISRYIWTMSYIYMEMLGNAYVHVCVVATGCPCVTTTASTARRDVQIGICMYARIYCIYMECMWTFLSTSKYSGYMSDFNYVSVCYSIVGVVLVRNDEIKMFSQSKMFSGFWFVELLSMFLRIWPPSPNTHPRFDNNAALGV